MVPTKSNTLYLFGNILYHLESFSRSFLPFFLNHPLRLCGHHIRCGHNGLKPCLDQWKRQTGGLSWLVSGLPLTLNRRYNRCGIKPHLHHRPHHLPHLLRRQHNPLRQVLHRQCINHLRRQWPAIGMNALGVQWQDARIAMTESYLRLLLLRRQTQKTLVSTEDSSWCPVIYVIFPRTLLLSRLLSDKPPPAATAGRTSTVSWRNVWFVELLSSLTPVVIRFYLWFVLQVVIRIIMAFPNLPLKMLVSKKSSNFLCIKLLFGIYPNRD